MRPLGLAFFMSAQPACGVDDGPMQCVTKCGAVLLNPWRTEFGGCAEFQAAEDAAMRAFSKSVTDSRFLEACSAVKGWEFRVRQETWFYRPSDGLPASGLTFCTRQYTELDNRPWYIGSYLHELAHVIQRCRTTSTFDFVVWDGYDGHYNWDHDGISAAIVSAAEIGRKSPNVAQPVTGGGF